VGVGVCFHKLGVALFRSPANTHVTIFRSSLRDSRGEGDLLLQAGWL
jgi:hypothetical protein